MRPGQRQGKARHIIGLLWVALTLEARCVLGATLPVIDIDGLRQMLTSYKTQLDQLRIQMDQHKNQVAQLQQLAAQVQQGQRNLQSLHITNLRDISALLGQLDAQLAQAKYINYKVKEARTQAEDLYKKATGQPTAAQQRALARQWASAQRDAAALAIKTQAIEEQNAKMREQWEAVQQRAQAAAGNLEVQQANNQGLALVGAQLQGVQAQLATAAREQSQRAMEEATRTEMEQNALDAAGKGLNTAYTPQGQARTLTTGQE
jgi:type IV secretion system protein TrbJ